jgi:peptide/nickel transport system ATP-binding protein
VNMLEVSGLTVEYGISSNTGRTTTGGENPVRAVDDVSFAVAPGEFVAIVGESGCGKSTLLFAVAQLLSPPAAITAGSVTFHGQDLVAMTRRRLDAIRWQNLSVVMQSAMNALNPVMPVGAQFADALRAHGMTSRKAITARSAEVLRLVGIDAVHLKSYPHQLSGGMRQRAMIAMALLFTPDLVIMDEPTSALDVVAQRSLMTQIKELQREFGFAVIFVTHDMSLVSHYSDRLMVMYAGQIVETGPTRQIFGNPLHPYSRGLLDAFPGIKGPKVPLKGIPGAPPDLSVIPNGCRFAPRCPVKMPECATTAPALLDRQGVGVRCLLYAEKEITEKEAGEKPRERAQ